MRGHVVESFAELRSYPPGAVVGVAAESRIDLGAEWAIRYPGWWKLTGHPGLVSDFEAWNHLGFINGRTAVRCYVDASLACLPPHEAIEIVAGRPERAARIREHTAGLEPGWYVTSAYFWEREVTVVAGPLPTLDDARLQRRAFQWCTGAELWLDEVIAIPPSR